MPFMLVDPGKNLDKKLLINHIKHLKDHPELALTRSNLMAVCKECHNELHPEKHRHKSKEVINEERW